MLESRPSTVASPVSNMSPLAASWLCSDSALIYETSLLKVTLSPSPLVIFPDLYLTSCPFLSFTYTIPKLSPSTSLHLELHRGIVPMQVSYLTSVVLSDFIPLSACDISWSCIYLLPLSSNTWTIPAFVYYSASSTYTT